MLSAETKLATWLDYIEQQHHKNIDMGLARSRKVFMDMDIDFSEQCVVTVAGTNGKGTSCRFIEQVCLASGLKTGVYASPHIVNFNERIRINGKDVSDQELCHAFNYLETVKADTSLSYFEYATLAAFYLFAKNELDICIIEVGLGGRLDATNIVDANVSVITSIGLDHQAYLGDTTELIAAEKAGIIKANQQVIVGYEPVHESVTQAIVSASAKSIKRGEHFTDNSILLAGKQFEFDLSAARIPKQNVMTAIASCKAISEYLNFAEPLLIDCSMMQGLINSVNMPGRMEVISNKPMVLLDVAHNEAAALLLVKQVQNLLEAQGIEGSKCHIIIGMLADKNIEATIDVLATLSVHTWHCVDLPSERGEKATRFESHLQSLRQHVKCYSNVQLGFEQAKESANENDIILVVGSFVLASNLMEIVQNT